MVCECTYLFFKFVWAIPGLCVVEHIIRLKTKWALNVSLLLYLFKAQLHFVPNWVTADNAVSIHFPQTFCSGATFEMNVFLSEKRFVLVCATEISLKATFQAYRGVLPQNKPLRNFEKSSKTFSNTNKISQGVLQIPGLWLDAAWSEIQDELSGDKWTSYK